MNGIITKKEAAIMENLRLALTKRPEVTVKTNSIIYEEVEN